MFAEAESEELLNLLTQVRLVADQEEQQQQQQQSGGALYKYTSPPPPPPSSLSSLPQPGALIGATAPAAASLSAPAAGRYTASSTAAAPTVTDWAVLERSGADGAGHKSSGHHTSPTSTATASELSRTPATGAKVLQHPLERDIAGRDLFEADVNDAYQQPKQLFFMDAHKRSVQQQQQQQRQLQGSGVGSHSTIRTPSTPGSMTDRAVHQQQQQQYVATALLSRESSVYALSPHNTSVMRGSDGTRSQAPSCSRTPQPQQQQQQNRQQHSMTMASISGDMNGMAASRPTSRDSHAVAIPSSAAVLSTVLSGYAPQHQQQQHQQQQETDSLREEREDSSGHTHLDELARIAAEYDGSSDTEKEEYHDDHSANNSKFRTSISTDRAAYTAAAAGHGGGIRGDGDNVWMTAKQLNTPHHPSSSLGSHADPAVSGSGGWLRSRDAAASATSPFSPTAASQRRGSPLRAVVNAEAVVDDFFRLHSATAAEMADANAQPPSGVSAAVERSTRGGTGRATHEQEAAWRLNVEAELHELQHNSSSGGGGGGADGAPGGGPSSQCVPVYKTPTTFTNAAAAGTVFNAVSPLSATATTPYHQLLSQLRHSPQSGTAMSATTGGVGRVTGGAVRANTPPDSRAFFATQFQQPPPMPQSYLSPQQQQHPGITRPLSAASGSFVADGAMSGGMAAAGVPRYTANVTCVGPSASSLGGDGRTMAAARPLMHGNSPGQTWSQQQQQQQQRHPIASLSPSSDTSATAAAVWERLSPYERAAAAAAAAAAASMSRPNSSALLHTPDTVAKPVTLSSIASHLHGDNYNGSDATDSVYSRPTMQQQQQQQLRFPTPPTFTSTTAAAAVSNGAYQQSVNSSIVSPSSVSYPRAAGVGRPSEASAVSGSGFSGGPLFLPTSPQGPHSTAAVGAAATAGGGVGGGGAVAGGPGRLPQAGTPSQLFGWPNPSPSSSPLSQAAPPRTMRSHPLQQQQTPASFRRQSPDGVAPYPFPQHLATAAAPAHSTATGVNSPPSCSLRPSPQMRATDGSSPTLRRYVITTPNARASSNNNTTTTTTFNSAGQHSTGVSPLGNSGQGNGASTTAATAGGGGNQRESRPRVQLSHMSHLASPGFARSPLNASSGLPHSAYGPNNNNNNNSMSASSVGGHGSSLSGGGGSMTAAVAAAAAASSVSAAAVRALIERLQAVAPAVLGTDAAAAAAAAHRDASQVGPELDTLSGSGVSALSNVPDVASASAILAMSHDQHGCRLLQAVLDTECESDDTAVAVEAVAGTDAGGERNAFSRQHEDRNNNNISAAAAAAASAGAGDVRRQRRAEAFYKSVAVQVVLRAIEPRLDAVMADGYGNFLLQKVFDMAPDAERQRLLRLPSLQNHLCEVACSPHGTFAVQRLVETVRNTEEERLVFVALEHDLLRLLTNANGGHVLMKVMECIRRQYTALANGATDATATTTATAATGTAPATAGSVMDAAGTADRAGSPATPPLRSLLQERVDALFTVMKENLLFVCQHKQGCCIVQKCLDFLHACSGLSQGSTSAAESAHGDHAGDYFERMSALLLPHAQELSVHPFGNYVITRLVAVCYARGNTATIDAVAAVMQRDLVRMCTNKFASNVVEHILRHCSERRIRAICQSLMHSSPANCGNNNNNNGGGGAGLNAALMATVHPSIARLPLTNVVMDSYGNYVIQTLLTVAPVEELTSATAADGGMLPVLQQLLPLLGSRNFGRKLETKTELAVLRVEQYQQQQQQQRRRA